MTPFVHYVLTNGIAEIKLDDGKRNALSPDMLRQIHEAFDRAERDKAIVIITDRADVFSAGFDLKVMNSNPQAAIGMLRLGYALTAKVMRYPHPVIAACNGHALAMGVFLMLSSDYVIGTQGDFRVSANEVAIGLTMPRVAAAVLRNRLAPSDFQTAVTVANYFSIDHALKAGFFDEVVNADSLMIRAHALAAEFSKLDMSAHMASKRRIRKHVTRYIRTRIYLDLIDAVVFGIKRAVSSKKTR